MDGHSTDEASTSVGEATATVTEAVNRTSHVAYSVLTELAWARERARREENALKAAEARADRQTKRGERMTAGLRRKVEAAMKKLNDPEVAKEIAAGDELGDLLEQGRAHVAAGGSREEWDKVFNTIEKSDREAARQWRERFDTAAKEYETANPVNGDAAGEEGRHGQGEDGEGGSGRPRRRRARSLHPHHGQGGGRRGEDAEG
ncbi:hypothetical protein H8R18_00725 [Nanchangia anserum]|uniref:hypothetical protein n=1 Tax=Nanchangia anserum TaxID=2692125 RepID=UPI0018837E5B|nr:hypothetical protein [Nanchangia anserum]QOX81939.1 hypothetical protein H8R18_00725 [Nanchangia anserum]